MTLIQKIKARFFNEYWPLWKLPLKLHNLWSDRSYLEYIYRHKFKKKITLSRDNKDLVLYTEKIQWLKLYDRQPEYTDMVDKYNVCEYVSQTIGKEYLIPIFGVWDKFTDIPFDTLPNQFVLKCTHDSGGNVICKDKDGLSIKKVEKYLTKRLARNFYWSSRQWAYKNIKPRILAQKFMVDESGTGLKDYKIFCFGGEPKLVQVDIDRYGKDHRMNFYSTNWEFLQLMHYRPNAPSIIIQKPQCLELMLELARKLSADKIHVRVDFFIIKDKLYFGELTFYNYSGLIPFHPEEWDKKLGDWICLPV